MNTTELVFTLALLTLAVVAVWAAYQWVRARQATRRNEHSSLSDHPGAKPSAPTGRTMDGRK